MSYPYVGTCTLEGAGTGLLVTCAHTHTHTHTHWRAVHGAAGDLGRLRAAGERPALCAAPRAEGPRRPHRQGGTPCPVLACASSCLVGTFSSLTPCLGINTYPRMDTHMYVCIQSYVHSRMHTRRIQNYACILLCIYVYVNIHERGCGFRMRRCLAVSLATRAPCDKSKGIVTHG
jgi:hypothetical protein